MSRQDLANEYQWGATLAALDRTADANGTGIDFRDCGPEVTCIVSCGEVGGGTLDVEMQESDDNSTWTSLFQVNGTTQETMTQIIVGPAFEVKTFFRRQKRYVRAVHNLSAGTPSYDCAVVLCARKTSY